MAAKQGLFIGPRLRKMRRELGLTQVDMAADLEISAPYIALMERNQRPVTADMLLRIAKTYKLDVAELAGDDEDQMARFRAVLKNPMFADIDIAPTEVGELLNANPGVGEVLLRLHDAYREEHLMLADRRAENRDDDTQASDPVAEVRRFVAQHKNHFGNLDEMAERLSSKVSDSGGLVDHLKTRHRLRVRRLPSHVMGSSLRRMDLHRREVLIDETISLSSEKFQLAQQLAYLELDREIAAALELAGFGEGGHRLAKRTLASYAAAAILMPYSSFAKAAESRRYDIELLARQFETSFEQVANRLTTLQRPGHERVPFFFIKVDVAGNVSKRLDGAGFPFARHGGGCPLWNLHTAFSRPGDILTQWLELPDGQRFFSLARTVQSGGGCFGDQKVTRVVALGCSEQFASKLVYSQIAAPALYTPIGVACRLCYRAECASRSEPPMGRQILIDDFRKTRAPYGFSDG